MLRGGYYGPSGLILVLLSYDFPFSLSFSGVACSLFIEEMSRPHLSSTEGNFREVSITIVATRFYNLDRCGIILANANVLYILLLELDEWRYLVRSRMKLMNDSSNEQGTTARY